MNAHFQLVGNFVKFSNRSTKTTYDRTGGRKKASPLWPPQSMLLMSTSQCFRHNWFTAFEKPAMHSPNSIFMYRKTNSTNRFNHPIDHLNMTFDFCHTMEIFSHTLAHIVMYCIAAATTTTTKNWLTSKYIYLGQVIAVFHSQGMRFRCTQIMAPSPHIQRIIDEMFRVLWKLETYRVTSYLEGGGREKLSTGKCRRWTLSWKFVNSRAE